MSDYSPEESVDDGPEDYPSCGKCGSTDVEWEQCWQCHGEGGFHDCGEDVCCCLNKEEITETCEECGGAGGYRICHGCIAAATNKTNNPQPAK